MASATRRKQHSLVLNNSGTGCDTNAVFCALVKVGHIFLYIAPSEYFTDAAVRDAQLPGDVTRPDALVSQVDNLLTNSLR